MHLQQRQTSGILFRLVLILSLVLSITSTGLAGDLKDDLRVSQAEFMTYLPFLTRCFGFCESKGVLDPGFGGDGLVSIDSGGGDYANAVAVQTDGKIVVAGNYHNEDFGLVRYLADGSLDPSFGSGGVVITDFGYGIDQTYALVLTAEGKIVAAGDAYNGTDFDFALARYNPDGSLDTSFGTGGKVFTDFDHSSDMGYDMLIQPDGKMILVGHGDFPVTGFDFALARYNPDGSLDTSFGGDGKVTTHFNSSLDDSRGVALQADGKIIAVGITLNKEDINIALARYNSDGSLDTSFSGDGKVTIDFWGAQNWCSDVTILPDGKILVVGSVATQVSYDFALVRYTPDGNLDASFGIDGLVTTDYGITDYLSAIILQPNGKILVAGTTRKDLSGFHDFALLRYNPDGSLDPDFGNAGLVSMDYSGYNDALQSVAIQADGKIVAVGYVHNGVDDDYAVVRYK